ncbi:PI-PLC X-box domain-containing protein DDB_G0293730 [Caerostris darwini]|uniref:PI-PLC X-box domain-containing protein DDB_G0293730 n=1 Tax=Caerostris darwini TaxID=1538125 RepID=A0AAV4PRP1_9ARAC|nr:PI-PLC X-box domain-containing protein DDB_G0293730 [Caerostris darwini]
MFRKCLFIVVCLVIIQFIQSSPVVNSVKDCYLGSPAPVRVFLTVSSLMASLTQHGVVKRRLEINWFGHPPAEDDYIAVYHQDPELYPYNDSVLLLEPHKYPGGYFRTNIEMPIHVDNFNENTRCFGYWAVYHGENGEIKHSTCLQLRPFWMKEIAKHISDLKLSEIMIPGSHDAGSIHYKRVRTPLSKYEYTQELSIYNQIMYGLRYFDLRVGYYEKKPDQYYINHNFLRTETTVKTVLEEVKKYLLMSTKDIIILDVHDFPHGFKTPENHKKLQTMIIDILGNYIIPYNDQYENATLSYYWQQQKLVLISYDCPYRETFFSEAFWPRIPRAWGNKQRPKDLKAYFKEVFEKPTPKGLWASMAEITPNLRFLIFHPITGLRVLADEINRNVTHWFRDLYWRKANIVATDYFLGNDIIDVAIRTNRIKGVCPEFTWPKLSP